MKRLPIVFAFVAFCCSAVAADEKPLRRPPARLADVRYGDDPSQVLDFFRAESDEPTPLVFYIHGGGWRKGSHKTVQNVGEFHAAGISVVSIQYRFVPQADAAGIKPPVKWPLHDAARALQFVRSKAKEWNIDKTRIGVTGQSAGAASSLWLAFHDDLAEPQSEDPIARESTRVTCAAVIMAQTCFDPKLMREWIPNIEYGPHAFGFAGDAEKKIRAFDEFLEHRDEIMPWIEEYSPYHLVTSDDPPILLYYWERGEMGKPERDATHSANFGVGLQEKCKSVGVECELEYGDREDTRTIREYLIAKLKPNR